MTFGKTTEHMFSLVPNIKKRSYIKNGLAANALTLIQTEDSCRFYGIRRNIFLFYLSPSFYLFFIYFFYPLCSEACRSLIMYNSLLPLFYGKLQTGFTQVIDLKVWKPPVTRILMCQQCHICFSSCIFNVPPALQDLCQTLPECSFPALEIMAC